MPNDDLPIETFASSAQWEAWLEAHHSDTKGIWIKVAKKASGIESVTVPEALEVALCFGWIDGQRLRFDDRWFLQKYTPRRAKSAWSRINRGKAAALIAEGRMRPAGQRAVDAARADGRWEAS